MNTRLETFLRECASTVYPEPRQYGHDVITEQMAALVAPLLPMEARILDVGCGQGPALEWFENSGFKAQGITANAEDFATCSSRGYGVCLCDMHDLKQWMSDFPFDCVWARHVLEHSPIPLFVLTEFARVLAPGGILYVEVPAPDTSCCHEWNANHFSVMGDKMWAALINKAGFALVESRIIKMKTGAGPDEYFSFIAKKI